MRTNAVIYLNRLEANFKAIKERVGETRKICVSVKSDGYGHGALKIAKKCQELGAYCLGVATVLEGLELRKGGIKGPILLFSQPHPDEIPDIIKADLQIFISDIEFATILDTSAIDAKVKLSVHLKIDTGMGRIGCPLPDALPLAKHIAKCTALKLEGTATHFSVSDSADKEDIDYTNMQITRFKKAVAAIKAAGINPGIVHAANTGAIILHPDSWFDMVRPGILLYGYKAIHEYEAPLEHIKKIKKLSTISIEPVMELKSTITLIKKIKQGDYVSYGKRWIADYDTYIGIVPVGYADGFSRLASNKWEVMIGPNSYPIIGRVCMDQCIIDLGAEPVVKRWDEVVVFGADYYPSEQELYENPNLQAVKHNAAAFAQVVETIPYEITCGISKRVPRLYVGK